MHNKIKFPILLRWIRETHVKVDSNELILPKIRSSNRQIKIYFDRISLTGFHHIKKVTSIVDSKEKPLTENELNNILEQEARYRVKCVEKIEDNDDYKDEEDYLFSIKNCKYIEEEFIQNRLLNISLTSKNQDIEQEKLDNLVKEYENSDNILLLFLTKSEFVPGISSFFPNLDGIGNLEISQFNEFPKKSGGDIKSRLWLNNPLVNKKDLTKIPSLYFFKNIPTNSDWKMRDATLSDLNLIHRWMNEPILAETFRQNYSIEGWKNELEHLISSPFTRPMIISYLGEECAYLEFYRPAGIKMGESFLFDPYEIGFHLGFVKEELINKKIGRFLMTQIGLYLLLYPINCISGLMGEPDVNNLSMFKSSLAARAKHVASIALPHKCSHIVRYIRSFTR